MKKAPNFMLPKNQLNVIKTLDNEQRGELFLKIYEYVNGEDIEINPITNLVFQVFKAYIDQNENSYAQTCETNRKNIQAYWDKMKRNTTVYDRIPSNTMATNINKEKENKINKNKINTINTNNTIIPNTNKNNKNSECENNNMPSASPTLSDILSYAKEKGVLDEEYCKNFFNHYESIGWVNGTGQKIKKWKLIFDNWIKKDKKGDNNGTEYCRI